MSDQTIIAMLVQELQTIPGIVGIVLGGSRARGTFTASSDIDLGLYYWSEAALDIEALRNLAAKVDDTHRREAITEIGEWGPRINGGAWLKVQHMPVDLLYRNMEQVTKSIDESYAGSVDIAYQPGHPHGFPTSMYMAEIALCRILWDPTEALATLQIRTKPYPQALKQSLIKKFFWEANFSLFNAYKALSRRDVSYIAGCCFRCVSCLMQTLFALNERYWVNEKGAVALAETFPLHPTNLVARTNEAFACLVPDPAKLTVAIQSLEQLVHETQTLLG